MKIKETAFPFASDCPGMDIRDYFAAHVMPYALMMVKDVEEAAEFAYNIAHCMIKERHNRNQKEIKQ